jgi:hypothetical protein
MMHVNLSLMMIFRIVTGSIGSRCAAKIFRENPFLSKMTKNHDKLSQGCAACQMNRAGPNLKNIKLNRDD